MENGSVLAPFDGGWVGEAVWVDGPVEPPSQDQAREAVGNLVLPVYTIGISPATRTYVNFETWFWANGAGDGDLLGTSAFGLVAVATPDRLVIAPGDGSAAVACPWSTTESHSCSYEYGGSSALGTSTGPSGQSAFSASISAVWSVHFERDGQVIEIPGAQAEVTGATATVPLEVGEIQAIIVD